MTPHSSPLVGHLVQSRFPGGESVASRRGGNTILVGMGPLGSRAKVRSLGASASLAANVTRLMKDDLLPTSTSTNGFVPVYAIAAGLAAAVPMPFVDSMLARTARGSAMRRVAARHGLTLAPEARRILGEAELPKDVRVKGYKVARTVVQRYLFPMIPISRLEDGLAALGSAMLFDSYLRHRPLPQGSVVGVPEALEIRSAIDAALLQGSGDLARSMPEVASRVAKETVKVIRTTDAEGRRRFEALVDHFLDAIADVPESMLRTLELRLEQQLASEGER